jgi:hypothetical protein
MDQTISRSELKAKIGRGDKFQLVEALPSSCACFRSAGVETAKHSMYVHRFRDSFQRMACQLVVAGVDGQVGS